ncbi:MAG: beta-xylosidase [Pseudonocardiaceae bacterium]|nr:beta-xylosidase [Pseudonocardiaceae bacterium]
MSPRRPFSRVVTAVLAGVATAGLVAACTPATGTTEAGGQQDPRAPAPRELTVGNERQSRNVVAAGGGDSPYNYGPTVMQDGGMTRMWWCSQLGSARPPGDDVLYAESPSVDGPFGVSGGGRAHPVFSGSRGGFDAMHTCDPSVIKVADTYYLYYTGASGDHDHGNKIGLATSEDGVHWSRANGGEPIVTPAGDRPVRNSYGVGQPGAVYLDGWFYLMFTDTTGRKAGWNGAGQFVLRAKDPAFGDGVQALTDSGFRPVESTHASRERAIVDAFSADLMWVRQLDAFAVAHETSKGTTLTFWDRDFTRHPYRAVHVAGPWREGPGLLRQPDGHAPVSAEDPCGRIPIDVVRATRNQRAPTDMRHFGLDITNAPGCANTGRALNVLDGFAAVSPMRTVDLVIEGKLLRIERRSVAEKLAKNILDGHVPVLEKASVAGRLTPGTPAKQAPGRGVGFLLDGGKLWRVHAPGVVELNSSPIGDVSPQVWDSYGKGPELVDRS